jgi:citrate lyase gamma subunit
MASDTIAGSDQSQDFSADVGDRLKYSEYVPIAIAPGKPAKYSAVINSLGEQQFGSEVRSINMPSAI